MPFRVYPVILKSIQLIKKDYYILVPAVIFFILLDIVLGMFPVSSVGNAADITEEMLALFGVLAAVIAILMLYLQTLIVSLVSTLLREESLDFATGFLMSFRKFIPVALASTVLFIPVTLFMSAIAALSFHEGITGIFTLWTSVVYALVPVIIVRDNLGIIKSIYKLYIFIKMNFKAFLLYSMSYTTSMLGLLIIVLAGSVVPVVGQTLLMPIGMGIVIVFLTVFSFMFYIECNEKRC